MSSFIISNRLGQEVSCSWACSASNITTQDRYNTEVLIQQAITAHPAIPADTIEIEIRKDSHNRTRDIDPATGATHFRPDDWHVTVNFRNAHHKASGQHIPAHIYHGVGDVATLERVQPFDEKNDSERARDASPPRGHFVKDWRTTVVSNSWLRKEQPSCRPATGRAMAVANWRVC